MTSFLRYHGAMKRFLLHNVAMDASDWMVDAIVAAAAFGLACLQLTFANSLLVPDELLRRLLGFGAPSSPALALAAAALTTLPLIGRRRLPWPVLAFTLVVWLAAQPSVGGAALSLVGPLVALFTLAYECSRSQAVAAALVMAAAVLAPAFAGALPAPGPGGPPGPGRLHDSSALTLFQDLTLIAVAAFAGYGLHVRQDYLQAAEERAEEAERTREATAQQRVEAERLRIAREVHDITAHSLSALSIQAAAAERLMDADPAAAKEAISEVRATAKGALGEIRAMVGVLRAGDGMPEAERVPTQGTERLEGLVDYLAEVGVEATIDCGGYRREQVPAYADVALFGVAREAVTNIARHAEASRAAIRLEVRAEPGASTEAVLVVADDGIGLPAGASGRGHGLAGMAERARLLGGTLELAAADGGGTQVTARIPLPDPQEAMARG